MKIGQYLKGAPAKPKIELNVFFLSFDRKQLELMLGNEAKKYQSVVALSLMASLPPGHKPD